jgi:hypothetical protein
MFCSLLYTKKAVKPLQNAIKAAPKKKMLLKFAKIKKRLRKEFIPKNTAAKDKKSKKEIGIT